MDNTKELIELFINKNYTIDLNINNKIKLRDIYILYEILASKLHYRISKCKMSKIMNEIGHNTYPIDGYVSYKLIPKINPEELTEDEITKFKKQCKKNIQKQFDLYKEKPLIKKIKKQKKEIIPYVESDDPCDIYEYHHKNPKK